MEISGGIPPATVIKAEAGLNERTAQEFRARLRKVPGPGSGPVIVDLSGAGCMDWTTLGEIAGAFRRSRQAGTGFGIVCGEGPVLEMLRTAGADLIMDIAPGIGGLACQQQPARPGRKDGAGRPGRVTADVETRLRVPETRDGPRLAVTLTYSAQDPYAVTLAFHVGLKEPVEWTFARDLLTRGLKAGTGDADVKVWPGNGDVLNVCLASPNGQAHFEFPSRRVGRFLGQASRLVPEGSEPEAVAAEVDALFAPGGLLHGGRHA